jgi:hypothetical protein
LRFLWDGAKGRRLRGALFVAATFDPDQRNRLILVNANGPLGTVALLCHCKRLQLAPSVMAAFREIVMRYVVVVLMLLFGISSSLAQSHMGTPQEQQACSRDASRFCRQLLGNDSAVQQCLQQNRSRLSRGCQKVFASHGM